MDKKELIKKLNGWNKTKIKTIGDKEIIVFENKEVFEIFKSDRILNPFNDCTYEWLSNFFSDLRDFLEITDGDLVELISEFENNIFEYADGLVNSYTSDLTEWLNDNINNVYYITQAQEENPQTDGFNILQLAQFKAIEELYRNALDVIKEMV